MITSVDYLLTCIAEECAEVAQRATKAIRFTLDEKEPGQELTNKERLVQEFNDLYAIMEMLNEMGVIDEFINLEAIEKKKLKVEKFWEYSKAIKSGEVANYYEFCTRN
jgi:hypothetical protein